MKRTKMTFLLSEICLFILLLLCMHLIFSGEKPQKRVAVIVEKSGDEKWDSFINGLKQAAGIRNIHLIICNTDEIEDAQEEKSLIYEQLDNQVDAFIVQAAPGEDTGAMLREIRSQKPVLLVANDVPKEPENGNRTQYPELPVVMPDNYGMGYALGEDLKSRENIRGKRIGIVGGLAETECSRERAKGVLDALSDTGCEIRFHIHTTYDMAITEKLRKEKAVDYLIVLETSALEQIAGMYASMGLGGNPRMYADDFYGIALIIHAGLAFSIMPASMADWGISGVVFRPLHGFRAKARTLLVYPRGSQDTGIQSFVSLIRPKR